MNHWTHKSLIFWDSYNIGYIKFKEMGGGGGVSTFLLKQQPLEGRDTFIDIIKRIKCHSCNSWIISG